MFGGDRFRMQRARGGVAAGGSRLIRCHCGIQAQAVRQGGPGNDGVADGQFGLMPCYNLSTVPLFPPLLPAIKFQRKPAR